MRTPLLLLAIFTSFSFAFGQTTTPASPFPCIKSFDIVNSGGGGNTCPASPCAQRTASGVVEIVFFNTLPAGTNPPAINSVANQGGPALNFCFALSNTPNPSGDRQTYRYCYYGERSNSNLINGNTPNYVFNITYTNNNTSQICVVPEVGEAPPPLPITLKSFNAKRTNDKVVLTWETASESNNSGFDIQRKLGGNEWESATFIPTKARGGNSNEVLSYQYTDVNTRDGITQYRLKQVDFDKKASYSDIRSVRGEAQTGKLLIYPNPSLNGTVTIAFEEINTLRSVFLTDVSGRRVKEYAKSASNTLVISNLQNGVYNVHITDLNTAETTIEKIIIKKR